MKVMSNGRKRRSESEWSEIISRFEGSGQSLRAFCRREGLAVNSLKRWQRRVAADATPFVELTQPSSEARSVWSCTVRLPDGTELQFGS